MSIPYANNLVLRAGAHKLCKAFGIKISSHVQIVQVAANAGYDALFIDMEHGWMSIGQVQNLCSVALLAGITPFVRVPHQCGNGFVQRVLDGGAMGIVFPHIHSAQDAKDAVAICRYPPEGVRSMVGQLPLFGSQPTAPGPTMQASNAAISVFVMIESGHGVAAADEIAAVPGVTAVFVGSMDLSIDLGVPAQWTSDPYRTALETISNACRKHSTVFGLAGVYGNAAVQDWALNTLGARFILVEQDVSVLTTGATNAAIAVPPIL
ncbi:hypothetical protein SEUCBS139899_010531 [Sporothrix eucalyptigena]